MENFIPYIVSLLIIIISLTLIFIKKTTSTNKNLPPGSTGWPLFGENIEFVRAGPQKFIFERAAKYSPKVFKSSIWGEKMAVFCGPEGNKFLFLNENKFLSSWWPISLRKALLYPNYEHKSIKEITVVNHRVIEEFLKPDALKSYIPIMDSMVCEHVEKEWGGDVKVLPLSKKYTFALACRIFLSVKDSDLVKRFAEPFNDVIAGLFSVPIELPGMAYYRAVRGGAKVRAELLKIIRNKRNELLENKEGADEDLLGRLIYGTSGQDPVVSEKEISNSIIGLLVASYDTTSTAVTFLFKYLAELPHIYNEVYKEQMEIANSKAPGELLSWQDIQKMKYSFNVICEVLRLAPPVLGSFKEATTDFTYAGFTIPKGWKTFWSTYSTHKNPDYFKNPEEFDPTRFEGTGPKAFTFVPFGGGPRMCIGKEYARLELLVFMHRVITKFKLEKLSPNEKVNFHASPTPMEGVPIRLHPHKN